MGRIIAIDYGTKRVGIAVTDISKIIANPLTTVHSKDLLTFLKQYVENEEVETLVVGMPKNLSNEDTDISQAVRNLIIHLTKQFPAIQVTSIDERYTSKIALDSMISMGTKKKDRRKKENIDKISATIILQSFLEKENQL